MKTLVSKQRLPIGLEEAWDFFSNPGNLKKITPPYMGFEITFGGHDQKMYPGMIIAYRVSPLFKISLTWVTEITHVRHLQFFVDKQIKGPYKFWHHQHHFRVIENGVEMEDILHYEVPGGIFGRMLEKLFIERKVKEIFNFRYQKLKALFGEI